MSNLNLKLFAQPETLRAIRPDLLLAWLAPVADYFARRGVPLPKTTAAPLPYEDLAGVFLAPTPDMPQLLVDSLHLVHGLATPEGMDALSAAARARRLKLDVTGQSTPADVAVQAWLLDPELAQDVYHLGVMSHPREFRYYRSTVPAQALPRLDAAQLRALEARLDAFYRAAHRGGGTRVFAYENGSEAWFLVRHGLPCRREEIMRDDEPDSIFYRPRGHDVLVYDTLTGQLRLHACGERERRVLLRAFGSCLFGNPGHFALCPQYTLRPIVQRGPACLACADIPGLERVELVGVHLLDPLTLLDVRYRCPNIFALVGRQLEWPLDVSQIVKATFRVKLAGARRPRHLTIVPWNKVLYGRDGDSSILKRWICRREFALLPTNVSTPASPVITA